MSSLKNSLNAVRQSRSEGSDMPCGANTLAFSLVTVLQINDQRCDCCACENKSFRFIHVFHDKTKFMFCAVNSILTSERMWKNTKSRKAI